jgi:phosphate ABC transporter phosphate-binding protein
MAVSVDIAELRTLLQRSGLLAPEKFEPAFANAGDADTVVARLLNERLLTTFQADQLWKRRPDGFFVTDKYKILDFIGAGGMGKVYLCEHLILHRLVALKVLQMSSISASESARAFERFYREARAVAALNDPNIIRVFDVDRVGQNPFMVMEYADGHNLHEIVSQQGTLSPIRAAEYIRQAALGLQHAHEIGLVHRDIKPGNLLLDRTGTVKLLDLGLARFSVDQSRNEGITEKYDKHVVLGTVDFMSPEQAFDTPSVDIRSDIYGLGCTFYYLMTGKVPFPNKTVTEKMLAHRSTAPEPLSEILPHFPIGMLAVLERMMAKDPADRYQTPAEVVDALTPQLPRTIAAPPGNEMPERAASFYRLGLSPTPGTSSAAAATPHPLSSLETDRTPKPDDWPLPFPTPDPQREIESASTSEEPSIMLTRSSAKSQKHPRIVMLALAAVLVLTASVVGGFVSRIWFNGERGQQQQRPIDDSTPPSAPVAKAEPLQPTAITVVSAGGSTFVNPLMQRWAEVYEKSHSVKINYQPVGSGKGIAGAIDNVYMFGCTDVALSDEQLAEARGRGGEIVHVPLAMGAVAVAYNVPDVPVRLKFTGPVLAAIYLGKISHWDDPALAACNPGVELPRLPITTIHRAESSGSTYIWTDYLNGANAEWKTQFGKKSEVKWPNGIEARGSNGMAAAISKETGSIGYLEHSTALEHNLTVGLVKNEDGNYVAPSPDGVAAAATTALKSFPSDLRFTLTHAAGETAYPIAGATWAILYVDQTRRSAAKDLLQFLHWATHEGQAYVKELKFAPLPPDLVAKIDERMQIIKVK